MPYLLVMLDKLSKRVMLFPCSAADTANAVPGLLMWIKEHGLMQYVYSDTATHFTSKMMAELEVAFGLEHVAAVPYSPWTNCAVERAGGIALELLRAVMSERRMAADLWTTVIAVVQYAMNSAPRKAL